MNAVRPFALGWHPLDPGPDPRSPLLDHPPAPSPGVDPVAAHRRWRTAVEADEARLLHALRRPTWAPLALADDVHVLPVFGGTAGAVAGFVTTLVTSGLQTGATGCRVVNLTGWELSTPLRTQMQQRARTNRATFDEVGARGSTVNLFGNPDRAELIALLVDALRVSAERSAGRHSRQEQQELERVVAMLTGPITLERLVDAVDVALGSPSAPPGLSSTEMRELQDYFVAVVDRRRSTQDRLTDLHVDLLALRGFEKDPARRGGTAGNGRTSVRWYDASSGPSAGDVELGRELLARAVLQTFAKPGTGELLVVAGAERLADEVRDELVNAAQRHRKLLALVYTQATDAGRRMLGFAGSAAAVFMRMPNPDDAVVASDFLGREYTFVINGISIAEGRTEEWSEAHGTSQSRGTSRSTSRTSNSGMQGGAFSFGRSVGSSVSSSFERGSSTTSTTGRSTSTTATRSAGRVHEYVVEPEVFQKMPEDVMMIVSRTAASLVSCDNELRWSPHTSAHALVLG